MTGFSTQLEDLRDAGGHLNRASNAAAEAQQAVDALDVSTEPVEVPFGLIDIDVPPDTPFGRGLGMPAVATAYEHHRQRMAKLLGQLDEYTWATGVALRKVADLYEESDTSARSQLNALNTKLDEI